MLKNAFLYRIALYEPKKRLYRETKSFFVSRKLYELHSKPLFYAQKLLLYVPFFAIRKKFPFSQTKSFSFAKSYTNCPQKLPFLRTKSLLFAQTFPCCYPKLLFSTLRLPFAPPLTYCPPKNTAVLLLFALTPFVVKPEPRTDSNHCRRYPAKLQLFAKPVT